MESYSVHSTNPVVNESCSQIVLKRLHLLHWSCHITHPPAPRAQVPRCRRGDGCELPPPLRRSQARVSSEPVLSTLSGRESLGDTEGWAQPQGLSFSRSRWGLRMCISDRFPGDVGGPHSGNCSKLSWPLSTRIERNVGAPTPVHCLGPIGWPSILVPAFLRTWPQNLANKVLALSLPASAEILSCLFSEKTLILSAC